MVVSGWQPKFNVSPGPGLWSLVLGPYGHDLGPDLDLTWDLDLSLTITQAGIQPICRPIIKMVLGNKVTFSLNLFKNYGIFVEISLNPLAVS